MAAQVQQGTTGKKGNQMFTWNFQYVSKARLAETFNQLMLNSQKGDILIRIHTAIHMEGEAVDLARFIKGLVPGAHIFGTSTSAVINRGKLLPDQCVISVTQMAEGRVKTAMLPAFDAETGEPVPARTLSERMKEAAVAEDTKLLLLFLTGKYSDVYRLIDSCNDAFPGVQMTGGVAIWPNIDVQKELASGFVFDETGWSNESVMLASLSGKKLESLSAYATGAQALGDEIEITDAFQSCILSLNGRDAAAEYRSGIGDTIRKQPELANLFPYVYSDTDDIPIFVSFSEEASIGALFPEDAPGNGAAYAEHPGIDRDAVRERITANHNVVVGKKLKRAFLYDRKIVADDRSLFRRIENFEKAETLFGYSCLSRSLIYSNCVKWELSAYENSNLCGCITGGEIAHTNGRNVFANGTLTLSVLGEEQATPDYNPYVFSHVESLGADNHELLSYLMDVEGRMEEDKRLADADSLRAFVKGCERKLMYSENGELANAAALNMDMKLKGYDRVCMINVADISSMKAVFPEQAIRLTYGNYLRKCGEYAREKGYRLYLIGNWQLAVGAPSYLVTLSAFVADMEELQRELFQTSEEYIAIVPIFCVIDDSTVDNVYDAYSAARVEMAQKNIQFYVRDAASEQLDEDSIRRRYHMVNVINYAILNDKVIPYFQGIYDNREGTIHHYESLMRLEDETGRVYYPGEFLGVARSFGLLYDSISKIMIRKVFEKFRNCADMSVSINLGIRDIKNKEIVEYIYEFLSSVDHPENFVFELLENEDVDEYEYLIAFVDKIHSLGGRISIDDFGSGYSNLQHVVSIRSDYLKIDGSIVKKCCDNKESENLIALISGWRKLSSRNVCIIAEYVENEAIQEKMQSYGIDFSQGYLFSKPAPEIAETAEPAAIG